MVTAQRVAAAAVVVEGEVVEVGIDDSMSTFPAIVNTNCWLKRTGHELQSCAGNIDGV